MTTATLSRPHGLARWFGFVVLCNAAGFVSALAGGDPGFYQELARPAWAPPPWLFGPVWTALYTLMGTATFLVWDRTRGRARRTALTAFGVQLALNMLWTPVFFGLHSVGGGLVVIALVLASVIAMLVVYARRVPLAAALIAPLAAWVAFATALNAALYALN